VNSGLILNADNEAELAGVMAHEIAHVAARHGTRQATRGEIVNLATFPLVFIGGGWSTYGIYQAASVLVPIGLLKFSRGFESEADFLGLEYIYKTGYDPTAFVDFFEKIETLEKRKPGTMAKVFSTHPMTDDRIRAAQKNIQDYLKAKPEYVVTTSEFNDVKNRLLSMHNHVKIESNDTNKPQLRRTPGSGTDPVDADENGKTPKSDEDERPSLKRRPSN
jgi:predicted Zn-dependent protease